MIRKTTFVAIACFLIAFGIDIDLRIQWGWQEIVEWLRWFNPADIHYETWVIAFTLLGVGILVGAWLQRRFPQ